MQTKTEKTTSATETKADKKEEATKVEEASAARSKVKGGRAPMCEDRKGAGVNQDDVRKQMLDAGSTPRPSVAGLERELEAGAKMPGGAVKAGHAPTPSALAGMGCAEWEDWDAEFKAITPTSAEQVAQDFQKIVRVFFANKSNATRMVAVLCEDGANLTGYVVVAHMHQVLQMPLGAALTAFAGARDPGIFHAPYIQDLYQRFGKGESAPSAPAAPAWALDVSKLVPVRGDFALPAARAGPLPVLSGQSAAQGVRSSHDDASKAAEKAPTSSGGSERLPPGWTMSWSKTHNRPYYFNKSMGKRTWDLPAGGSSGGGE
jgi:hypothetical protein